MAKLSTQERRDLQGFLDDDLLEFIMDEHTPPKRTPTMSYVGSEAISSPALPELTEKELDEIFSKALEQHLKKRRFFGRKGS